MIRLCFVSVILGIIIRSERLAPPVEFGVTEALDGHSTEEIFRPHD